MKDSNSNPEPYTFRLPKNNQTDPHFGCTRTFWNEKILPNKLNKGKPPIKSIVERQPGSKRGIRLILYRSARAYFEQLAKSQSQAA